MISRARIGMWNIYERQVNARWCILTIRPVYFTRFRFIWPCGFRGEDFLKSANQKQELPMAVIFVNGSVQNEQSVERTFHGCFLPSFTAFGWGVPRGEVNGRQTTDDGRRTPSDGKSSHCLLQGELKKRKEQ
jgi:hypothetical protein